MIIKDCR